VTARREELARARDLLAAIDARVVDEQREWSGGVALLTPSLPKVWDANYLRLDEGNAAGADALASEAAEIAAGAGIDAATTSSRTTRQPTTWRPACETWASTRRGWS
jgi:nucleotide-binding universal stress UspA family protein